MNDQTPETEREKLKELLRCIPPGRETDGHAELREALDRDSELRAWYEREREIDRLIGDRLKAFPVPEGLRGKLLSPQASPQLILFPWAFLRNAAIMLLTGGLILWGIVAFQNDSPVARESANTPAYAQFTSGFFSDLTSLFEREPEFDYFSQNLSDLRLRVKEHGGPEASDLPEAIDEIRGLRCRLFDWEQAKVALICMRMNEQSYHLFVIEDPAASPPDSPRAAPRFNQMENWSFASWGGDGKTYVLGTRGSRGDLERIF